MDIAGRADARIARFALERGEDHLWFAMHQEKAPLLPEAGAGHFYFGLWRSDCGELFLSASSTGRYLEVNLAPNGAYWIGVLSGPRQLDATVITERWPVVTDHLLSDSGWSARLGIPFDRIVEALGAEPDRVNVTAVLDGCPDEDVPTENLRSIAPIDTQSPDFHVPDRFVPLTFRD